jgi:glutathione S-transferase
VKSKPNPAATWRVKTQKTADRFTAGDLMMSSVLRILRHTDIVTSDQRLAAYVERCTARPAFQRALDAQLGDFRQAA